jgi:hypothetical protein
MDKQQLHEQLEQLHAALHQIDFSDNNEREILRKLGSDIQDILARQEAQTEHYQGLGKRLKDAVAQLEASHPEATLLMRQVIDQIAYMGI